MDQDNVRVYMVLGPPDDIIWSYTPIVPRWRARDICRDFSAGIEWEGKPVLRVLIVDMGA